jgi:hypothetical protein
VVLRARRAAECGVEPSLPRSRLLWRSVLLTFKSSQLHRLTRGVLERRGVASALDSVIPVFGAALHDPHGAVIIAAVHADDGFKPPKSTSCKAQTSDSTASSDSVLLTRLTTANNYFGFTSHANTLPLR